MGRKAGKISPQEEEFCRQYLIIGGRNAAEAARQAGYSEKFAERTAWRLLQKQKIQDRIAKLRVEVADVVGVTPHMLAAELKRLALSDIGEFVDFGPSGVTLKHSDVVDTRCVAEVSETTTMGGGSVKFKLHDKLGAINSLNKMFGWNAAEKQEHSGPGGKPIPLETKVVIVELPSNGRNTDRPATGATD